MVTARTMVYVSNADSREIYVLELADKNGSTKIVNRVAVTGRVMPLAISPDRKFLYASLRSQPYSVSSFTIDVKSGDLTFAQTVQMPDDMAYVSTDRTGRWLFGASYFGSRISVSAIDSDGKIDSTPLHMIRTSKHAHSIATDLTNAFLFVPCLGDNVIMQFQFDASTGDLTPSDPPTIRTQEGAGPRHIVFHPNGRLVFCTNELNGTVSAYRLDPSGTLSLLDSFSTTPADFNGKPWNADIHLTPDGRFLYASERSSSTIAAFQINDDTGALTLIDNYPTETQPRGFNIDPAGSYLIVVGQKSNGLSIYEIDQETGTLRKLSHVVLGLNPNWVEIITLPK
jgi:6-phosphogluconolactonase